jgi:hypothetical protein
MEEGRFYASTGVELDSISVSSQEMKISIHQNGTFKYTTEFIGKGGRLLARTGSLTPTYRLGGDETYVRARITDSGGQRAWVQPVFVTPN